VLRASRASGASGAGGPGRSRANLERPRTRRAASSTAGRP
jgi:hypothetical protein